MTLQSPTLSQGILDQILAKLNSDIWKHQPKDVKPPILSDEILEQILAKLNDDIHKTKPKPNTPETETETGTNKLETETEKPEQIESDARIDGTADVTFRNTSSAIDEKGKMVHGKPRIKSYTLTEKGVLKSSVTE